MRSRDAKIELLRSVALFGRCTRKELARLAALSDEVEVPAGKVMTREGEPGREFFVILEGRAKVSRRGRRIATLERGAFFGEMALLDQGPRSATVEAESPMTLLVLSDRNFFALVEELPSVTRGILRGLAVRLRDHEKTHTH